MLDLLSKLIRPANIHAIVNGAILEASLAGVRVRESAPALQRLSFQNS